MRYKSNKGLTFKSGGIVNPYAIPFLRIIQLHLRTRRMKTPDARQGFKRVESHPVTGIGKTAQRANMITLGGRPANDDVILKPDLP